MSGTNAGEPTDMSRPSESVQLSDHTSLGTSLGKRPRENITPDLEEFIDYAEHPVNRPHAGLMEQQRATAVEARLLEREMLGRGLQSTEPEASHGSVTNVYQQGHLLTSAKTSLPPPTRAIIIPPNMFGLKSAAMNMGSKVPEWRRPFMGWFCWRGLQFNPKQFHINPPSLHLPNEKSQAYDIEEADVPSQILECSHPGCSQTYDDRTGFGDSELYGYPIITGFAIRPEQPPNYHTIMGRWVCKICSGVYPQPEDETKSEIRVCINSIRDENCIRCRKFGINPSGTLKKDGIRIY